ncbi:MAG: hypothetical protein ACPGWR_01345 [Ardenticatenaceae bacterium]
MLIRRIIWFTFLTLIYLITFVFNTFSVAPPNRVASQADVAEALQNIPVMFMENVGPFDDGARFPVRGGGMVNYNNSNPMVRNSSFTNKILGIL